MAAERQKLERISGTCWRKGGWSEPMIGKYEGTKCVCTVYKRLIGRQRVG